MGNRAVISFDGCNQNSIGIYLHWNGGRDSIEAFLKAARELSCMGPQANRARLIQVIGTFFNGGLSVYVDYVKNLDCDNYDNGVYIVDSNTLEITGRKYFIGDEQRQHDVDEMAADIIAKVNAAYETEGVSS